MANEIPKYSAWIGRAQIFRRGWNASFVLLLNTINEEVRLYGEAFSPMAKRNVALTIHERIGEFEKAWKKAYAVAPMPPELVELDAAAREQVEINYSGHKYDYVSCIGYAVGTIKFHDHVFAAYWNGVANKYRLAGSFVDYSGKNDDVVDSRVKCAQMKNAITTAFQLYQSEYGSSARNSKTLKIFMAPEFFFRGVQGAYDITLVPEIFSELRRFTSDAKFSDWLFVFGTVIGASFDDRLLCRNCGKLGASQFQRVGANKFKCPTCPDGSVIEGRFGARIDNVALIQKGGESDDKNAHVVMKEYVSHVDFQRTATVGAFNKGKRATGYDGVAVLKDWNVDRRIEVMGGTLQALPPPGSRDVGGSPGKFADERMGGAIFTVDGIKFGLEICLDHLNSRLARGSGVQVQLVPSGGAALQQFACVSLGIAFNVDGGGAGTCDVRVNNWDGQPELSPAPASRSRAASSGTIFVYAPEPIPYR
jgi:hypothetical protein